MEIGNSSVSVVIPAYNAEATISDCLKALKQQTLPPLEVIVVDDGSKDRTVEIAKDWAVVIPNTRRKGAGGVRNTGAYAARGDLIAFTDSDCIPTEDWLKKIAAAFSDADVVAVGGGYSCGYDNSFWQLFCFEELTFRRKNRGGRVETLVSNNFACRKSIFLEEGGFPEGYPVCEDMFLSYKISQRGKVLWLNENGIRHLFKDSLKSYLKHQYFFGAESTRFFLQNPKFLTAANHQGKRLHSAIMLALLSLLSLLLSISAIFLGNFILSRVFLKVLLLLLLSHLLLYLGFIRHLVRVGFPNAAKAYGVSFLRDLYCSLSFFDGLCRALANQKEKSQ